MDIQPLFTNVVLLLCCCNLVTPSTGPSSTKPSEPKSTATIGQHATTTTHATPPTITERKLGIMDIPMFDFSKPKPTAESPNEKSAIASIRSLDLPTSGTQTPTKSCGPNMCELMDGFCNQGTCIPQDCQSVIVCECFPGYSGTFCDRNITEVDMAKDVPMLNGKILSTESPRTKVTNGKQHVNGKTNETTGTHGNGNGTSTSSNNNGTGKGSLDIAGNRNGTVTVTADPVQIGKNKYTQPKGSFIKGPEVPTPKASESIRVSVNNQKIKTKSTAVIKHLTETITIATVSVNFKQSLTLDASGKTVKGGKSIATKKKKTTETTTSRKPYKKIITKGWNSAKRSSISTKAPATERSAVKSKPRTTTDVTKQTGDLHNAKHVEQVVLTHGTVQIIDKSVKPVEVSSAPKLTSSGVKDTSMSAKQKP